MSNHTAPIAPALAYNAEPTTEMVEIRRDGQYVTTVYRGSALLAWFHQNCPMSMHWALENEGYSIHEVPERFVITADIEEDGKRVVKVISAHATRLGAKRAYTKFQGTDEAYEAKTHGWHTEIAHNGAWVTK
jgi:hypothetical protein